MWAAHCRESPATSPNRDGEAAQMPRVFSLSPANQAGELIDSFLVKLRGENSTPFDFLTSDQDRGGSFGSMSPSCFLRSSRLFSTMLTAFQRAVLLRRLSGRNRSSIKRWHITLSRCWLDYFVTAISAITAGSSILQKGGWHHCRLYSQQRRSRF
jgi:hypothetical protein